jgi:hypothetical protein
MKCSLIIFGSRNAWPSIYDIDRDLDCWGLASWDIGEVVSGKARDGADVCGDRWAVARGIPVKPFPADWDKHGKVAGFMRNEEMANYAHRGLGYWRGWSSGTANMATCLVALDKPVKVVRL